MAKRSAAAIVAAIVAIGCGCLEVGTASASPGTQGVTATTIRVGIPYVDVAAVKAVGVHIDWGSVPDAYNSVIADINAHGGILGRKIVPFIIAVDPTGAAPAATTCTALTQDDKVFAVIAPLQPTCYLQNGVPVVAAVQSAVPGTGLAQNFALAPPASAYDPLALSIYAKRGIFKNKKVAVFAGTTTDDPEMKAVLPLLAKLHVNVVSSAEDSAPQGDLSAENQQIAVIAQRFQAAGADEVVAVGNGSALWPEGLSAIQSSYNPPWVATNEGDFTGDVGGSNDPKYLANVVTSTPIPAGITIWNDPGTQRCVKLDRKAYPSNHINTYSSTLPASQATGTGIEQACTDLALFSAIAKAAGKHLTVASFVHAAYGLRHIVIPGYSSVSFGPNQPYNLGGAYMVHYDPTTKSIVTATKPITS
jgi:ABC-type branched-subunit amino acid transport system substrate-binding protein